MASIPREQPDSLIQENQFTSGGGSDERTSHTSVVSNINVQVPGKSTRVISPDLLRGFIIVLQGLDHAAVIVGAWSHGVAVESEMDGVVVSGWNTTTGWIVRMLTHLCAPGFMFLMGMGISFLGHSRSKLGWSRWRFVRHFFIRAFVLVIINEVLGLAISGGKVAILNIVLLALAVNYFLGGLLWLVLRDTESLLATSLEPLLREHSDEGEEQPLLADERPTAPSKSISTAANVSFHIHSFLLVVLTIVTIGWNVWLSRDGGHCKSGTQGYHGLQGVPGQGIVWSEHVTLFDFMFYMVYGDYVMSAFPPLAWISFVILGLLYGRLFLRYPRPANIISAVTASIGAVFAILFVLTRLLHFGNMSEDCLRMPENVAHPEKNQYLVGFRAFFYATKYPPSPAYMFYTMSFNFLLLAAFSLLPALPARKVDGDSRESFPRRILRVFYAFFLPFGQCALFFYSVHQFLFGGMGTLLKKWFGHELGRTDPLTGQPAISIGNTPVFWLYYFFGLTVMWLLCRWYSGFKATKGPDSLWRFF